MIMSRLSHSAVSSRIVWIATTLLLIGAACAEPATPPGTEDTASSLKVGDEAPDFTLPSAGGEEVSLADYRGEKAVLLYFSMGPG
jgi:cytochrome oxidase Cu insertion factor (SCO1/SenC/PrrC family)